MMKIMTLVLLLLTFETNAEDLAKRFKELYVEGTYSIDSRNRNYNPSAISEFGIQRPGGFCKKDGDLNPCIYSFVVKADGTVSYQRIYPPSVEHQGHIGHRYLTRLLDLIEESDFLNLNEAYTNGWSHCSITHTKVVQGGQEMIIRNCDSGPAILWAIEKLVDEVREYVI